MSAFAYEALSDASGTDSDDGQPPVASASDSDSDSDDGRLPPLRSRPAGSFGPRISQIRARRKPEPGLQTWQKVAVAGLGLLGTVAVGGLAAKAATVVRNMWSATPGFVDLEDAVDVVIKELDASHMLQRDDENDGYLREIMSFEEKEVSPEVRRELQAVGLDEDGSMSFVAFVESVIKPSAETYHIEYAKNVAWVSLNKLEDHRKLMLPYFQFLTENASTDGHLMKRIERLQQLMDADMKTLQLFSLFTYIQRKDAFEKLTGKRLTLDEYLGREFDVKRTSVGSGKQAGSRFMWSSSESARAYLKEVEASKFGTLGFDLNESAGREDVKVDVSDGGEEVVEIAPSEESSDKQKLVEIEQRKVRMENLASIYVGLRNFAFAPYKQKGRLGEVIKTIESDVPIGKDESTMKELIASAELSLAATASTAMSALSEEGKAFVEYCQNPDTLSQAETRPDLWKRLLQDTQAYWKRGRIMSEDLTNFLLFGPPGTGKSTIARSIATFMARSGILASSKGEIKTYSTGDFRGRFVGESEAKTSRILLENFESTLFIDEAHRMGSTSNDDVAARSLSKIMSFITSHPRRICVVMAGYEKEFEKAVFNLDSGFKRRFVPFKISLFSPEGIMRIFVDTVAKKGVGELRHIDQGLYQLLLGMMRIDGLFKYSAASAVSFVKHLDAAVGKQFTMMMTAQKANGEARTQLPTYVTERMLLNALWMHADNMGIKIGKDIPEVLASINQQFAYQEGGGIDEDRQVYLRKQKHLRNQTIAAQELVGKLQVMRTENVPSWQEIKPYLYASDSIHNAIDSCWTDSLNLGQKVCQAAKKRFPHLQLHERIIVTIKSNGARFSGIVDFIGFEDRSNSVTNTMTRTIYISLDGLIIEKAKDEWKAFVRINPKPAFQARPYSRPTIKAETDLLNESWANVSRQPLSAQDNGAVRGFLALIVGCSVKGDMSQVATLQNLVLQQYLGGALTTYVDPLTLMESRGLPGSERKVNT